MHRKHITKVELKLNIWHPSMVGHQGRQTVVCTHVSLFEITRWWMYYAL